MAEFEDIIKTEWFIENAIDYSPHIEVYIGRPDGETWEDVTEYVTEVTIEMGDVSSAGRDSAGTDLGVRTAVVELFNSEESFHPLDEDSDWNTFEGEYTPLLQSMREVLVYISKTPPQLDPVENDFRLVFHGYLGEDIESQEPYTICHLTDLSKRLSRRYVLDKRLYPKSEEDEPVWNVIQDIIDDEFGSGEIDLYSPSGYEEDPFDPEDYSDVPMVGWDDEEPFGVQHTSVWEAVQNVAQSCGWFLGYRLNSQTDDFELTLIEPDIDKDINNPDHVFDWTKDFKVHELDLTDRDIRNNIRVVYDTDEDGNPVYVDNDDLEEPYSSMAQDSQDIYGKLSMEIEVPDTRTIKYEDDAIRFLEYAVNDLTGQHASSRLEMPLTPDLDLFDGILVIDPRYSSEYEFFGVETFRHTFTFGEAPEATTEVVSCGKVTTGHHKWLHMETREGGKRPIKDDEIIDRRPVPAPKNVQAEGIKGGIKVSFDEPQFKRWKHSEVHVSTQSGFTPSSETFYQFTSDIEVEITRGLSPGETYFVVVRNVDNDRQRSEPSDQASGVAQGYPEDEIEIEIPEDTEFISHKFIERIYLSWYPSDRSFSYELRTDDNWGEEEGLVGNIQGTTYSFPHTDIEGQVVNIRDFDLYVRAKNSAGYSEGYDTINITNPVPEVPEVPDVTAFFNAFWVEIAPLIDEQVLGYYIYVDELHKPEEDPVRINLDRLERFVYEAEVGEEFEVTLSAYDVIGEGPESSPPQYVKIRQIESIAEFAQELRPPELIDELPSLPDGDYPEGSLVVWTEDKQLYMNIEEDWTTDFDLDDLTVFQNLVAATVVAGAIGAEQIAADAIIAEHIGSNEIITHEANIEDAIITSAKIIDIEADKIRVGGRSTGYTLKLPEQGQLFHFDDSLMSTQGVIADAQEFTWADIVPPETTWEEVFDEYDV